MKIVTCDKCGGTIAADLKSGYMHLQGINAQLGLVDIDLCEDCYKLLDDWLEETPDGTLKVHRKAL